MRKSKGRASAKSQVSPQQLVGGNHHVYPESALRRKRNSPKPILAGRFKSKSLYDHAEAVIADADEDSA